MKINLSSKALAAIVGFALVGVPVTTRAQESADSSTSAPTAPASTDKPAKDKVSGKIEAISSTSITVAHKRESLVMAITSTTKFGNKKSPATQADFAIGDKVECTYSVDGSGNDTAVSICKKTPKTESTETPPAAQ